MKALFLGLMLIGSAAFAERVRLNCKSPDGDPSSVHFELLTQKTDAGLIVREVAVIIPSNHSDEAPTKTSLQEVTQNSSMAIFERARALDFILDKKTMKATISHDRKVIRICQ